MQFHCPMCDERLELDERRSDTAYCPVCREWMRAPRRDPDAISREPEARRRSRLEDDRPRRDRFDVTRPPPPRSAWPRFISPSMAILALLTLPLPWLEVSCTNWGTAAPQSHYSQTGLQIMTDTQTDLPAPNAPPNAVAQPREPRPMRQFGLIFWAVLLVTVAVVGFVGRGLAFQVPQLCGAIAALLYLPFFIFTVSFGEFGKQVTWTPWPFLACLACLGSLVGTIVVLVRDRAGSEHDPPPRDDDDD